MGRGRGEGEEGWVMECEREVGREVDMEGEKGERMGGKGRSERLLRVRQQP
jgi:hypothetical protein